MYINDNLRYTNGENYPLPIEGNCIIYTRNDIGISANSNITQIKTLKKRLRTNQELKIIYVLPVLEMDNNQFGDGLELISELMCSDEIEDNVVFIQPTFITTPWFGNHPTDVNIQQEDNMIELIQAINTKYSMFDNIKTYLFGFSKSGNGAMTLQLKYPQYVDGILIWDAPLNANSFITTDMANVFGNEAYFQNNYYLIDILNNNPSSLLNKEVHIGGYQLWQTESDAFVQVLDTYPSIIYTEDDSLTYAHTWLKPWIKAMLLKINGIIK